MYQRATKKTTQTVEMNNKKTIIADDQLEEAEAQVQIWKYIFGFAEMAVVKCAIDLGIADAIESHGGGSPITLSGLASALQCSPASLYRIMRFLTHRGIFKQLKSVTPTTSTSTTTTTTTTSTYQYAQTPLSKRLMRYGDKSMAAFMMLETSPVMLSPWLGLCAHVLNNGVSAFEAANGNEVWTYATHNSDHARLINEAMADGARVTVPAIINERPEIFRGLTSVVDVGGGNGTALSILVKACPWIRGINFDLQHVVSVAPEFDGVEHVGGNMFASVPKADAAFIMWVLHDWNDEECIKILKNCREAIIQKKNGKVIIVEAVIQEEEEEKSKCRYKEVGLMLDMVMMAHTNSGKERTSKEWAYVLDEAGFKRHTLKTIRAVQSVIEAYPS